MSTEPKGKLTVDEIRRAMAKYPPEVMRRMSWAEFLASYTEDRVFRAVADRARIILRERNASRPGGRALFAAVEDLEEADRPFAKCFLGGQGPNEAAKSLRCTVEEYRARLPRVLEALRAAVGARRFR